MTDLDLLNPGGPGAPNPTNRGPGESCPADTEGHLVDSWRVWSSSGDQVPTLYTVQVYQHGPKVAPWWTVWTWDHWVGYWMDIRRTHSGTLVQRGDFPSLQAARGRAQGTTRLIGARRWAGADVVACDAPGMPKADQDRWVRLEVDPPPPWAVRWPGPHNWRAQL